MNKKLRLPGRSEKPRQEGITHVIDKGLGVSAVEDFLKTSGGKVDIVKLGWGTAIVTENIKEKIGLYGTYGIPVCFGGTLLEVFLAQDNLGGYLDLLKENGIRYVEISSGVLDISIREKVDLIKKLAKEFTVISEVGSKDACATVDPRKWIEEIKASLDAGVWKVITEGRESGTVGVYRETGEIKSDLIDEIVAAVDPKDLIFETPNKKQQVWFVKRFGTNVNLGNIAPSEVIPLETLRLGLRGDTLLKFHGPEA